MTSRIYPRLHVLTAAFAALLMAAATAWAQDPTVSSGFHPAQIDPGDMTEYDVTVSGTTSSEPVSLPRVDGLQLVGKGQSSRIQMGNGQVTADYTLQFQMRADKTGNYTMPAFTITANGKTLTVPAATLEVTDHPTHAADAVKTNDLVSLTASLPRTELYVGERLPMDLTLTYRADLQPQTSGEFTMSNDDFERVDLSGKPRESVVPIKGQRFGTATWQTALSPIKAGAQTLQFSMPLQVTLPGQSNDPMTALLMGNAPNLFAQQQSVNLQSPPLNLNVLPLPDAGRPENFTGGIGNFTISTPTLDTTDLQVGVPVTLKFKVTGQGNFDRMQAPKLDLGALWRSYTPKDTFQANDAINYRGEKTFEYVVMPMAETVTELPAPQFNFFDPETKTYVEPPLAPIPVKVRPAPPGQSVPLPVVANAPGATRNSDMVGLHIDAGDWQDPRPRLLLASPYFWAAQAAPALLFATFVITRRRKLRLENDPVYARRLRARQQALAALERARATAAKGDAAGFYAVAQRALQEAASHDRLDAAEALTWQEFDAHLAKKGLSSEVRQQAHDIFEAGDALRFSGFTPDQADLTAAAEKVDQLVKQLLEKA
jgi:hypothetical protein